MFGRDNLLTIINISGGDLGQFLQKYAQATAYFNFEKITDFSDTVMQVGHDVGGNFNIHILACSGDFIVTNR